MPSHRRATVTTASGTRCCRWSISPAPKPTGPSHLPRNWLPSASSARPPRNLSTPFPSPTATREVPTFVNEFWTAKQRQASSLHEISYRACFKPQLPRFFIERLTRPGEVVYDPFMGRGTTVLEAALLGRVPCGCDINPLSVVLTRPRLCRPPEPDVAPAASGPKSTLTPVDEFPEDLLAFLSPRDLRAFASLKKYLLARGRSVILTRGRLDLPGRAEPADRPFAGLLLRLHPAAQPGRLGQVAAQDQRRPQTDPAARDVRASSSRRPHLLRDCDAATARDRSWPRVPQGSSS